MSARFGIRDEVPSDLDRFMHDVWRAKKEGDMPLLDGLLSQPLGESKSGLHALREGFTALAKLAAQEHAAERREQGWKPWLELLGDLVAEHGNPSRTIDDEHGRRLVILDDLPREADGRRAHAVCLLEGEEARVVRAPQPAGAAQPAEDGVSVADQLRDWARVVVARGKALGSGTCPTEVMDRLKALGDAKDLPGIKDLAEEIQGRLEALGSNSEPEAVDG